MRRARLLPAGSKKSGGPSVSSARPLSHHLDPQEGDHQGKDKTEPRGGAYRKDFGPEKAPRRTPSITGKLITGSM